MSIFSRRSSVSHLLPRHETDDPVGALTTPGTNGRRRQSAASAVLASSSGASRSSSAAIITAAHAFVVGRGRRQPPRGVLCARAPIHRADAGRLQGGAALARAAERDVHLELHHHEEAVEQLEAEAPELALKTASIMHDDGHDRLKRRGSLLVMSPTRRGRHADMAHAHELPHHHLHEHHLQQQQQQQQPPPPAAHPSPGHEEPPARPNFERRRHTVAGDESHAALGITAGRNSASVRTSLASASRIAEEEWAALFRNNLLRSCWKPGLAADEVQYILAQWERKLVEAMHRWLHPEIWAAFRVWNHRTWPRALILQVRRRKVLRYVRPSLIRWRSVSRILSLGTFLRGRILLPRLHHWRAMAGFDRRRDYASMHFAFNRLRRGPDQAPWPPALHPRSPSQERPYGTHDVARRMGRAAERRGDRDRDADELAPRGPPPRAQYLEVAPCRRGGAPPHHPPVEPALHLPPLEAVGRRLPAPRGALQGELRPVDAHWLRPRVQHVEGARSRAAPRPARPRAGSRRLCPHHDARRVQLMERLRCAPRRRKRARARRSKR